MNSIQFDKLREDLPSHDGSIYFRFLGHTISDRPPGRLTDQPTSQAKIKSPDLLKVGLLYRRVGH